MRRPLLHCIAGVAAFAATSRTIPGLLSARETSKQRPNVILVMTDDQGWGDTGYNGHPFLKTPNLDEMAASGIRFNRFYSGAPVCSPTRGSAITGRHPYRYGIAFGNTGQVLPQEITLAEAMRKTLVKWQVSCRASPAGKDYDGVIGSVGEFGELEGTEERPRTSPGGSADAVGGLLEPPPPCSIPGQAGLVARSAGWIASRPGDHRGCVPLPFRSAAFACDRRGWP